jgi:hypothetical protein
VATLVALIVMIVAAQDNWQITQQPTMTPISTNGSGAAADALAKLPIKGRAPKTGYARTQFGNGWALKNGCDTRNIILHRDLANVITNEKCQVVSGLLHDPYTGKDIQFERGADTSGAIQIDHVVALSDAWQTGAQQLTADRRQQLANDPLELLAVDGPANQQKSDGDAATWLPPNKVFRCQYVARQVAVKQAYGLWVTQAEHDAIAGILASCPGQSLPSE